jgi:predicted N-acyltransferase
VPFLHFEVCYYQPIEYCLKHGLIAFEPGHGGGHKYPRGFEPRLCRSSHWLTEPRFDRAIRDYLRRERAAVLAQTEELLAASPLAGD